LILASYIICDDQFKTNKSGYGSANAAAIQGAEEALKKLAAAIESNYMAVTNLMTINARIL